MISFTYSISKTNLNSNQNITSQSPSSPQLSFSIDYLSYLSLPKSIFIITPCEITFLLKHKNLPVLSKLMIKETGNPQTNLSMVNFIKILGVNNFLP